MKYDKYTILFVQRKLRMKFIIRTWVKIKIALKIRG